MPENLKIPAIKVHQWIDTWDEVQFGQSKQKHRAKPKPELFLFSIDARRLFKLSDVFIRKPGSADRGIQRMHDNERSEEIKRFLKYGYPLSDSKGRAMDYTGYKDLYMPGWLPTAIIVNILPPNAERRGNKLDQMDCVEITEEEGQTYIKLPSGHLDPNWAPSLRPLEIIDGQHRLWAFDKEDADLYDYQLPVVAFDNLDLSWQAYLFYTINIKPKKINRSLAYDLIPMLRVEEWLEKSFDEANVYKETRAQEIVDLLWSYPTSPWFHRINMLGEKNNRANITQAAFIRNLTSTFFKTGPIGKTGGLFATKLSHTGLPLEWNRTQQIAFIIFLWKTIVRVVESSDVVWLHSLYKSENSPPSLFEKDENQQKQIIELAFFGKYSLISTDQGVRGLLHIFNDFFFDNAKYLDLNNLFSESVYTSTQEKVVFEEIENHISLIEKSEVISSFTVEICQIIVNFDWRTSSFHQLTDTERRAQMVYKGGSGYKELRRQLLLLCSNSDNKKINASAKRIFGELGFGKTTNQ